MSNSATPLTIAHQAPLSMRFSRQEYWSTSGVPFPSPGDLPDPGKELGFPALAGGFFYHWATRKDQNGIGGLIKIRGGRICAKPAVKVEGQPCPSEEELMSLLKVKEESEKVGLKLNIQKTKIMASGPTTSWQIDGETMQTITDFIFWAPKSLQMVTAAMKLKGASDWTELNSQESKLGGWTGGKVFKC